MAIFYAPFSAVAVSAAQDLWEIVPPADSFVLIREIRFGQYTDFGDAAAEILSVTAYKGYTSSGSGGGTITPVNRSPVTGAYVSTTTVERNNTTQASTSGTLIFADAWNIQTPFLYLPEREYAIAINPGQRFVVSVSAPADSITMNGVLTFEEIGHSPA